MKKQLALMARAEEQVYDKIKNATFGSIVNRVVLGALPIDESELTKPNIREISKFTAGALEAAGGYALLENAIENCTNFSKKVFLQDIRDVCESAASAVATRVAKEAEGDSGDDGAAPGMFGDDDEPGSEQDKAPDASNDENHEYPDDDSDTDEDDDTDDDSESIDDVKAPDDTKPVPLNPQVIRQGVAFKDLVADAKMTDEEYNRFVAMRDKLDLPEVSKLINHRVTQAMLAEKETYQMIDEANQKLKDAITDKADDEGDIITDDQADEIKESVLEVPLKNHSRSHVSVFSKIQSAAIEAVLSRGDVDVNKPNADILLDVTTNYTFDIFGNKKEPTLEQTLKRLVNYKAATEACDNCTNQQQLMNLGTAFASIIYTFLQAINTMNLTDFTPKMAKDLCDNCGPLGDMDPRKVGKTVDDKVSAALETERRAIHKTTSVPQLESYITQLQNFKSSLESVQSMGIPVDIDHFKKIDSLTSTATNKISQYEESRESTLRVSGTSSDQRRFETDKGEIDRVALAFRTKDLDKIVFRCNEGASYIDVVGLKDGRAIGETSVALESAYTVPTAKYLKALVASSKLNTTRFGDQLPAIESWIAGIHTNLK